MQGSKLGTIWGSIESIPVKFQHLWLKILGSTIYRNGKAMMLSATINREIVKLYGS